MCYIAFSEMIGKRIKSVELSPNKETIRFEFDDGTEQLFGVEGDCCSCSWIEHLEMPNDVIGATVLEVKDGGGVPWDGHACAYDNCTHDCLQVYNTHFKTNRGDIVLEYRNDSNGYYGGYLVVLA